MGTADMISGARAGAPETSGSPLDPPFGTFALPGWAEALRRFGHSLGRGAVARRVTSLIRRICLLGRPDPVDVEPFPGQKARLYPRDNLSEKRVFSAVQFWDAAEREALRIAAAAGPKPFHFVDAGANAGLYTLAVLSFGQVRCLAVEPDAENLRRLTANLSASGTASVTVAPVALSDVSGHVRIASDSRNRGELTTVASDGGQDAIPAEPLLALVEQAGFDRIDALKIDIEGAEEPVLRAFLDTASRSLWPTMIVIEARRGEETPALSLLRRRGYAETGRTKMNAILTLQAEPSAQATTGDQNGQA